MKFLLLIIIFIICCLAACSQKPGAPDKDQQRLYGELKGYDFVESQFKGYDGVVESVCWQKADSFLANLTVNHILYYLNDSSGTIKYYAWLKLLGIDDRIAFEQLRELIADTSRIMYWFNDGGGEEKFNRLLAREYKMFIYLKYFHGGTCTLPDRHYLGESTYRFPKPVTKTWKLKFRKFNKLLNDHSLIGLLTYSNSFRNIFDGF